MTTQTNSINEQSLEEAKKIVQQNSSLIDGCCLMGAQVRSCGGERTLPNASVEVDGNRISNNLVKGSKIQWFPKNRLNITTKYTQRISRLFMSVGVRYGDLTVVPKDKLDALQPEIEKIQQDYTLEVGKLVNDFDDILSNHRAANPDVAHLIDQYALSKAEFFNCFSLTFLKPLAITPLYEEDVPEMVEIVGQSMFSEIAKEAMATYKASWYKDKKPVERLTQKIKSPLKKLREKLKSFLFVDEGVINVLNSFNELFDNLPKAGHIEGHDFLQLTNFIHVMSDEDKLRMHAEGMKQFAYEQMANLTPESFDDNSLVSSLDSSVDSNQKSEAPKEFKPFEPVKSSDDGDLGFGLGF